MPLRRRRFRRSLPAAAQQQCRRQQRQEQSFHSLQGFVPPSSFLPMQSQYITVSLKMEVLFSFPSSLSLVFRNFS